MRLLSAVAALILTATAASTQPADRLAPAAVAAAYPETIRLDVDASDIERRIVRVRQSIPVAGSGPLTLLYPQWLPGNHAPTGQLEKLAGLRLSAGGRPLPWRRDPLNLYAFTVDVPTGARALDVEFQFLQPTDPTQLGRVLVSTAVMDLQWTAVLLYPAGHDARAITVRPSVRLPRGWSHAVALDGGRTEGDTVAFAPTTLDTLIDSPLFAGRHHKAVMLDEGRRPVRLNLFAEKPEQLAATPEQIARHRALVGEADALFGVRRFDRYEFLLALSDTLTGTGIEHLRSSENIVEGGYFTDWDKQVGARDLLPHEYVHSWNGKFTRPAGLARPDFNTPVDARLLWLYEGGTTYWGMVLAARSGLWTKVEALEQFADMAAVYAEGRPGRSWRSVEDTTADPAIAYRRPRGSGSWQRGTDYYTEGALVWLEADTLIRERSGGRRSLDDFARGFFGAPATGGPLPETYGFEDVVAALNAVEPHDWAGFLTARMRTAGAPPPLGGIAAGGYRLAWSETPGPAWKAEEASSRTVNLTYSLGLVVNREGKLTSVLWDGPAFVAGLSIGHVLVGVNGAVHAPDALKAAITAAKTGAPVTLTVKSGERLRTVRVPYRGGLRHPVLERTPGPARLDDILKPRA